MNDERPLTAEELVAERNLHISRLPSRVPAMCVECGEPLPCFRLRLVRAALRAEATRDEGREYDSCEQTHAPGTTHYHPLRVSGRIKAWQEKRDAASSPEPVPSEDGLDVERLREAIEKVCAESGVTIVHAKSRRANVSRPMFAEAVAYKYNHRV